MTRMFWVPSLNLWVQIDTPPLHMRAALLLSFLVAPARSFVPLPAGSSMTRPRTASVPVFMGGAKDGIFTPIVKLTSRIMGKERFVSAYCSQRSPVPPLEPPARAKRDLASAERNALESHRHSCPFVPK